MLEALEDFVKRQRKRLQALYQTGITQRIARGETGPKRILGSTGGDDEAAN
jgi:hypothetical protein